jgi:hypothetical protein
LRGRDRAERKRLQGLTKLLQRRPYLQQRLLHKLLLHKLLLRGRKVDKRRNAKRPASWCLTLHMVERI